MNSIIGQRRNQQQNKTKKNQNRVNFCSSFYVWLIGKTIISSKVVYMFHVKIWRVRRRMFYKLKGRFSYFFQFSKNRQ